MHLELTEDQEFFRTTARRFLEAETPLSTVRELYDSRDGFDRGWWARAAELGWTSLLVAEEHGGGSFSGRPTADAVIVAEELGRMVAPGPFIPVNLVALALSRDGSESQRELVLSKLLRGESVAAWAFCEPGGRWDVGSIATSVVEDGNEIVVDGTKSFVESAACAEHILVTGRTPYGLTQVLVPANAAGVRVISGRSLDMTRRFGRVELDAVRLPRSALVGRIADAGPAVELQLRTAIALQCAGLVGVADRVLEFTLEYGHDRFAFGRPIVSFQALKHRIADMAVLLEGSKAVADALAAAVDDGDTSASQLASVAKAYVGAHALDIVDDCVQITGGIGVTWEHDIHMYNRRAAVDRAVFGSPEEHKQQLLEILQSEGAPT